MILNLMTRHFYQGMLGYGMIFEIEKGFPRVSQPDRSIVSLNSISFEFAADSFAHVQSTSAFKLEIAQNKKKDLLINKQLFLTFFRFRNTSTTRLRMLFLEFSQRPWLNFKIFLKFWGPPQMSWLFKKIKYTRKETPRSFLRGGYS